jgi:hypothetical protein
MEYKNYTNLGIISPKKPFNAHLIWETNTSGTWYMVDSTDQTILLKTTDKGDNYSTVANRTRKIQSGWYDRSASKIYFVSCDQVDTQFTTWYLDLSDDSENAQDTHAATTISAFDIVFSTTDSAFYVLGSEDVAATIKFAMYKLIAGNWTLRATEQAFGSMSFMIPDVVHAGGTFVTMLAKITGGNVKLFAWDDSTPGFFEAIDIGANTDLPSGWNQRGISKDVNNIIYFLIKDTADANKIKLHTYDAPNAILTKKDVYNVSLMLDRNTASGIQEKAFHITSTNIYQLHSSIPYQLHLIANPTSDAVWIVITDSFLMNDDREVYEYEDVEAFVMETVINMEDMNDPSGSITLLNTYPLAKGMFITIKDMFTTAGSSANSIIFEGYVGPFTDRYLQEASLISPAKKDLDDEFPSGDYSGRTDEIIVSLLSDYADYITAGTMTNGIAMGTITFGGDKSLREILDEFALTDGFIWYLTPTGILLYNAGTVDSVENFTEASKIWNVNKTFGNRAINYVNIKGAFVDGAQISGTIAQDQADQQIHGRIPFERTFAHLDLAAQCTTTNTNILTRLGTQALIIPFSHSDPTVGVIQVAETATFQYNRTDPNISSGQFGIRSIVYNAKQGKAYYIVSDRIL